MDKAVTQTNSDTGTIIGYVGDYCIQCLNAPEPIEQEWIALQAQETASIYQNYDWVRIACKTLEKENSIFIVTGRNQQGLQFVLPMVLDSKTIKTLRWIGGSHANICSGIFSEDFLTSSEKNTIQKTFRLIGKSIGGIAKSQLQNQPLTLKSYKNPLSHLHLRPAVNNMYDMDLRDGLDAILDAGSGKRKRKLWRKQNRVAEAMGGYELTTPVTKEEITTAVNEFINLKGQRLEELGIHNIFSDKNTIDFFHELSSVPEHDTGHLFRIYQLKIQNKTRAMYAIGINGKYCQAYVNAVEYDDFADHSPGEMILYAMIERLIEEGYERFDLGVGYERYKRSWCPGQHPLFDTNIALTPAGIPVVLALRIKNRIKRYVRNNPELWVKLKKLRKVKASIFKS